jgi:hypothetical protein
MALGLTEPLKEMSTRNLTGSKGLPARKTYHLTAICEPIAQKMWEPRHLTNLWASTAIYRNSFTFFMYVYKLDFLQYANEENKFVSKLVSFVTFSTVFLRGYDVPVALCFTDLNDSVQNLREFDKK